MAARDGKEVREMGGNNDVKHICIVNPESFARKVNLDAFIDDCSSAMAGRDLTVHISRFPRDAIGVIRDCAANLEPGTHIRVYAVGGDGILFDCLNGVIGLENADIAPMPYGAANDFVRAFGEGQSELFRDISRLADACALPTDVIHSTRNYALNFCALGLESYAFLQNHDISRRMNKPLRILPFLPALARRMIITASVFQKSVSRQYYRVAIDDEDCSGIYTAINIANGPYYGKNKSAVIHAAPNDGWLDALFTKDCGPMDVMKMAPAYLSGQYQKFPDKIFHRRGRKFSISSDAPMLVSMDGEIFYDTRLTLEIIPNAVRIVAPAGAAYKRRDGSYA
jgi:diacylglycerol kinase family enzyme